MRFNTQLITFSLIVLVSDAACGPRADGSRGASALPAVCRAGDSARAVKSDCVPADQVDSTWLTPDSSWTSVASPRLGLRFKVPGGTSVRLRGLATRTCLDTLPSGDGKVVDGSHEPDALLLRLYFTRAPFDRIADRAGFNHIAGDQRWWLAGDQQAGVASEVGDGRSWRGLDAVAAGHWGEIDPQFPQFGGNEDAGSGMYDLRVALGVFSRADGCQLVVEALNTKVDRTISRIFSTFEWEH